MKFSIKTLARRHPILIHSGLICLSVLLTLGGLEMGFRYYLWRYKPLLYTDLQLYHTAAQADNAPIRFEPHPYLSFSRTDTRYDSQGIWIGEDHFSFDKPEGVIRIACIGGSTTMLQHPRFLPRYLTYQFNAPRFEVMDFGVDSWTSQESLINYMIRIRDFSPDVMLIHHGVNDGAPRVWGEFKPDYSNFRVSWRDQTGGILRSFSRYSFLVKGVLYLKGIMPFDIQNYVIRRLPPHERLDHPAENSIRSFQRNITTLTRLARDAGSQLILAPVNYHPNTTSKLEAAMIDEHNRFLIEYARDNQMLCVDTKLLLHQHPHWFLDTVHLKPPGILMNTQLFAAAVRDSLRGYSETTAMDGTLHREVIQRFDAAWAPERLIRLRWGHHIPGVTDYHIYVREMGSSEKFFLANTRDPAVHTLEWKSGNPLIKPDFKEGPQIGKDYLFNVFAIVGEHPFPSVGPTIEPGVFEIEEQIIYHPRIHHP